MATLRNAWQAIGNIGNPATTIAAQADITSKLAAARKEGNESAADLFTGLGASDADRIVAESEQLFNTGNPLLDNKARTAYAAEQVGIQSPQQLSKRFNTQLANDQEALSTELGNKDLLETSRKRAAKQESLKALGGLRPGSPEYKQALEEQKRSGIINDFDTSPLDKLYSQEFGGTQYEVTEETIRNAIGLDVDINDPTKFGVVAENNAIKTISDKIEKQWPGIQDKSIFDTRAKDILGKSKYGQNFDRQTKLEAGETTQDVRLKGLSSNIAAAIRSKNPDAVDNEVNATLDFLQANNITGEKAKVFDKNVELALDRSRIDPAAIFQNAEYGNTTYGTTQRISPTKASMLQADIKAAYREKYPNLPDRLLDPQVAKVISANQQLGFAIAEGKKDAAYKANLDADFRETGRAFKGQQHKALFAMAQDGTKTYIADRLIDKLSKLKFKSEDGFTATDAKEVQRETSEVVERLRGFFTDDKGDFLAGASKQTLAAFRLAASKAIIGNAGIDEDSLPGDGNDLVFATVNRYRQMSDTSDYELLKLFVEALPDSQRSVEYDSDKKINVRKGINRFTQFAKGRMKDAHAVGLRPTKSGFTAFKTGINSLGLGADFDRLPPINSTKYQALMTPVNEQDRTKKAAITALTQ
tara:strand:+ start:1643 stop:3574 length:1932 start_codon:yes stop_codon:yes gene_type:complete